MTSSLIRLLRPHQWIKNGFVWIRVLFSKRWDLETLALAGLTFLAFCAMVSAIYILNDLFDLEAESASGQALPPVSLRPD